MSATTVQDGDIAAAYASGLSERKVAAKFGIGRGAVQGALRRACTPPRRTGAPVKPRPWAERAAARHLAGERVGALAREYGVGRASMRRVIERQGVTVTPGPQGRPRGYGMPAGGAV